MKRLLKVQQEIGTLSKNAKNPFFKSQYLDLTTIIQHVTPLLNAEGLLLVQPLSGDSVTTAILDAETGDTLVSSTLNLPNITDPQKLGSAITYFRRYTLKSLLAIAEEDDDGNKASAPTPKPVTKPALNQKQLDGLSKVTDVEVLRGYFKTHEITEEQKGLITKLALKLKDEPK